MESKKGLSFIILVVSFILTTGCSGLKITPAGVNTPPNGIRVYPPKTYLFVNDSGAGTIAYLPDYQNGYDIKPKAFLMKQEFTMKMTGGQITELTDNQDPTAVLALIQGVAQKAMEAVNPIPVSADTISVKLPPGIYVLNKETGNFDPILLNTPPGVQRQQ